MRRPNFLLGGTAKAGTSFVYLCLREHPEVFVPDVKEPMYFALGGRPAAFTGHGDDGVNGWSVPGADGYDALFRDAGDGVVTGECSTWYLYHQDAPRRIHEHSPSMKFLVILRDPVERAYSAWLHLRRDGRETESDFADALRLEPGRIEAGYAPIWHYRAMSLYAGQVRRYRERFPDSQLKFVLHQDLRNEPVRVLQEVFEFLEVDPTFRPDLSHRVNVSEVPKDAQLERWLSRPSSLRRALGVLLPAEWKQRILERWSKANRHRPVLRDDLRDSLRAEFRGDILELQDLLGRDLSAWLDEPDVTN